MISLKVEWLIIFSVENSWTFQKSIYSICCKITWDFFIKFAGNEKNQITVNKISFFSITRINEFINWIYKEMVLGNRAFVLVLTIWWLSAATRSYCRVLIDRCHQCPGQSFVFRNISLDFHEVILMTVFLSSSNCRLSKIEDSWKSYLGNDWGENLRKNVSLISTCLAIVRFTLMYVKVSMLQTKVFLARRTFEFNQFTLFALSKWAAVYKKQIRCFRNP